MSNEEANKNLLEATSHNNDEKMLKALQEGANPNTQEKHNESWNSGYAAIHYAVRRGYAKALNILIEHGANLKLRDGNGYTPLMLARKHSMAGIVDMLEELLAKEQPQPTYETSEKWVKSGEDRVTFIGTYPGQEQRITEIFNFHSRQQIVTVKDLDNKQSTTLQPIPFKELDKSTVEKAFDKFSELGGNADRNFVLNGSGINKQSPRNTPQIK